MENAALLARISTTSQKDNSSSDTQLQNAREYCRRKSYNIAAERIEIMSGSFVLARSVFNELLEMAAEGQISVIVSDRPDRLGRGDAISKLELLAQLNNARIEYAVPGHDTTTTEGLIQHSVEQMVSGIERQSIRRRTRNGKYEWARNGRVIAVRNRPYGYEFVSKRDEHGRKVACSLIVVPEEAEVVHYIYKLIGEEALTIGQLVNRLNKENIPAMQGGLWRRPTLYRILKSETYKGIWRFGKYEQKSQDTVDGVRVTARRRDNSETVEVPCPAIVDEALWNGVQEQLSANRAKFLKPTVHSYTLRTRIWCSCGRRMAGNFARSDNGDFTDESGCRGRRYYLCNRKLGEEALCGAKRVRADLIERIVWEIVSNEIRDIDKLIRKVREQRKDHGAKREHIEQAITVTKAQINKANERYNRFESLYGDGLVTKQKLAEYHAEHDKTIQKYELERRELEQQLVSTADLSPDFEQELRGLQQALNLRLTPDTPRDVQMKIYEMLRVEVVYDSHQKQATIKGLFGKRTLITTLALRSGLSAS
jgi:site-specific DNA recombinase